MVLSSMFALITCVKSTFISSMFYFVVTSVTDESGLIAMSYKKKFREAIIL